MPVSDIQQLDTSTVFCCSGLISGLFSLHDCVSRNSSSVYHGEVTLTGPFQVRVVGLFVNSGYMKNKIEPKQTRAERSSLSIERLKVVSPRGLPPSVLPLLSNLALRLRLRSTEISGAYNFNELRSLFSSV